jgi:hypothetical protein
MISSVDHFSNAAAYLVPITQQLANQLPHNEEARFSIQKNKSAEESNNKSSSNAFSSTKEELSEEDLKKIEELKKRDAEVRAHEQAHQSAAGSLSNGATSFDYDTGPDGKRYAVGGEVSIDTSKVAGDPQATIEKARQVRRAALAPADPSGPDRQVAAQAIKMETQATQELSAQKQAESTSTNSKPFASTQTDFYNQIQSSTTHDKTLSMLDYFA